MITKLKTIFVFILAFNFSPTFAGTIDYFDVKLSSDTTQVGEALDLTITAMDKDNNIVEDYIGTILVFSETDPKAELPNVLNESSYTFTLSDAGSVKFENAIIFNSTGKQDLHVYDLDDDTDSVAGIVEVDVTKPDEILEKEEIEITSPENGTTLTTSDIQVAGKTISNHRIIITANGTEYESISNTDGIFETTLSNIKDGDIILKAKVLNSDDEEIGDSDTVSVKVNASAPQLLGISTVPPEGYPNYEFVLEIVSEPGLEKVVMLLNDNITELEETQDGTYTTNVIAPSELGEYPIGITLQNSLGVKGENPNAVTIKVIEEPIEDPIEDPIEEPDFNSADQSKPSGEVIETLPDLTITGLTLTKLKTKSTLQWDAIDEADFYEVSIIEGDTLTPVEKVTEPRITINITGDEIKYEDFVVKAVIEEYKEQGMIEGDLSDAVKIQTGPEKYLLLILIAILIGGALILQKRILRK